MSSGDIDDHEADPNELARLRRENRDFNDYLEMAWKKQAVRSFFIPYAAGISEDGNTVYISYDMQTIVDGVECESALVRHETTEWALRFYLGIGDDYADDPIGHRIANNAEFDRARKLLDRPGALELYQEVIDGQVHKTERMPIEGRPIPEDLALYPYEDDPTLCDQLRDEMYNARSLDEWEKLHPEGERSHDVQPQKDTGARGLKLSRDAFIYLDPKPPSDSFAQCRTCRLWVMDEHCYIHGPDIKVTGSMSCALYIHGDPLAEGSETETVVTPTESGLVDREVRCENCKWGGPEKRSCELFNLLNHLLPNMFQLDVLIDPKGCCNAQQPREA